MKIGCADFTAAQEKYQTNLNVVEVSRMFQAIPKTSTLEKWRKEAPKGFEFVACSPTMITHSASGHTEKSVWGTKKLNIEPHKVGNFRNTGTISHLLEMTLEAARILESRLILFKLNPLSAPQAELIGKMQAFFKSPSMSSFDSLWEPPITWSENLVRDISNSLKLSPVQHPWRPLTKWKPRIQYFRIGSPSKGKGVHAFTLEELQYIKKQCQSKEGFVIFNNGPTAFYDASRFLRMVQS